MQGKYFSRMCISEVVPDDVGYQCSYQYQLVPNIHTIRMLFFVQPFFIGALEWLPNYEMKTIVTKLTAIFFYWNLSMFTTIDSDKQKQRSKFMQNIN